MIVALVVGCFAVAVFGALFVFVVVVVAVVVVFVALVVALVVVVGDVVFANQYHKHQENREIAEAATDLTLL